MALIVFTHRIGNSRAQEASGPGYLRRYRLRSAALMVRRGLWARILAHRGQHGDAGQLVRSAALAVQASLLSECADTRLELSHVLAAAVQALDAPSVAAEALGICQRKGDPPEAQELLRYATQPAPAWKGAAHA